MIEYIDSTKLSSLQQGCLFIISATVSMLYHFLDRYVRTGERLLNSSESVWTTLQVLLMMLIGSTFWAESKEIANSDIVMVGIALGFAAFSKRVGEINDNRV
jgi:hypothetical protein